MLFVFLVIDFKEDLKRVVIFSFVCEAFIFSYAFCVPYLLGTFLTSLYPLLIKIGDFKSILRVFCFQKVKDNKKICFEKIRIVIFSFVCFLCPLLKKDQEDFKEDFNGKDKSLFVSLIFDFNKVSLLKSKIRDTNKHRISIKIFDKRHKKFRIQAC